MVVNGWTLYEHELFVEQKERLVQAVEAARKKDPGGYQSHPDTKLLAAINQLTKKDIPSDPGNKRYQQGNTLGAAHKHWYRAKFGNGRYRLFYQFNSKQKVIIYAWVNDDDSLRTYGSKTDAYSVFKSMLGKGNPPDKWDQLAKAVGAVQSKAELKAKPKKKKR